MATPLIHYPDLVGSQTDFMIPFDYISPTHVLAYKDGVEVSLEFLSTYIARVSPAPSGSLTILRKTPTDQSVVEFTDGSVLVDDELNLAIIQALFVVEEAYVVLTNTIAVDVLDDKFDATGRVLKNLGSPVDAADAVTKLWAETGMTSQLALATAARVTSVASAATATTKAAEAVVSAATATTKAAEAVVSAATAATKAAETLASAASAALSEASATLSAAAALVSKLAAAQSAAEAAASALAATSSEASAAASALAAAAFDPATFANVGSINGGSFSGFRNAFINGNFDHWQRGTSGAGTGYRADRWAITNTGQSITDQSRQAFTVGQTAVPGNPQYFHRSIVGAVTNAASDFSTLRQKIAGVATYSGGAATVTLYMKAATDRSVSLELVQDFGSAGSAQVTTPLTTVALTTSWQRFDVVVAVPSVSGKTVGANNWVGLYIWQSAGTDWSARVPGMQAQPGTFDLARASFVKGDATAEDDPYGDMDSGTEFYRCLPYYSRHEAPQVDGYGTAGMNIGVMLAHKPPMRVTPTISQVGAVAIQSNNTLSTYTFASYTDRHTAYLTVTAAASGRAFLYRPVQFDAEL